MTKLKFDNLSLNQIVKPSIQNTIDSLKQTLTNCELSVPPNFEHSQFIYDLKEEITTIINDLTKYSEWLKSSTNSIENTIEELNQKVETIEEILVKNNEHIVSIG